jgi:hypothetical protein
MRHGKIASMKKLLILVLLAVGLFGCRDRANELNNGVMYATNALEQVGANPFSRATYQGIVGRGGNPADYIKATLPKEKPPFDSFEYQNPTHPWTIVIRPSTDENEFFIEGYGIDVKKPMVVKAVTVRLPSSE